MRRPPPAAPVPTAIPDPPADAAAIAELSMSFERQRTLSGTKITRQPKDHLNKISVRNGAHDFRRYIKDLVIAVDQIDGDGRSSFTREQLKIPGEYNNASVLISREIEQVRTNNRKRISEQSN